MTINFCPSGGLGSTEIFCFVSALLQGFERGDFYIMIIVKYLITEYKISSHIHIKYHAFYRTIPKIRKRNSWPQLQM